MITAAVTSTAAVSIHVPLAEHDVYWLSTCLTSSVSIHVPLAEHDGQKT